jgi:hypothetical protein
MMQVASTSLASNNAGVPNQAPTTSFIVSTKAGVVNFAQGSTTVKAATVVKAGTPIGTGPNGRVEILLNPGSFLRIGANSQVILDRVQFDDMAIHVLQGSALVEANGFRKDLPLTVSTGNLKMEIIKDGIYLFHDGRITVVDGKIRDAGNGLSYGKGFQISDDQGYRARKVQTFTTELELWSQQRDAQIASANANIARSLNSTAGVPYGSFQDVWLWYPLLGSFIYMPGRGYHSPYGYTYRQIVPVVAYGGGGGGGGGVYRGGNGSGGVNRGGNDGTAGGRSPGGRGPIVPSGNANSGYSGGRGAPAPVRSGAFGGGAAGSGASAPSGGSVGGGRSGGGGPARSTGK